MKNHHISLVLGLSLLFLVAVSSAWAQSFNFSKDLAQGNSGQDVVNLQTFLMSNGYTIPSIAMGMTQKGYFGAQTKSALINYQRAIGLPATGFFGPMTRSRINGGYTGNNIPGVGTDIRGVSLAITSPNGNEVWQRNTTQYIRWTGATGILSQSANIWLDGYVPPCAMPGNTIRCMIATPEPVLIAQNVSLNNRAYAWNVGDRVLATTVIPDGQHKVRICLVNTNSCDTSDAYFTITGAAQTTGPLKIVYPRGGETWRKGTKQTITWTSPAYVRETFANIRLIETVCPTGTNCPALRTPYEYNIFSNININQNTYQWTVGDSSNYPTIPEGWYKLQICEAGTTNCATTADSILITNENTGLLRVCPAEKIVNMMPSISERANTSYYILNGQRREIAEFDAEWVSRNCTVPVQQVY